MNDENLKYENNNIGESEINFEDDVKNLKDYLTDIDFDVETVGLETVDDLVKIKGVDYKESEYKTDDTETDDLVDNFLIEENKEENIGETLEEIESELEEFYDSLNQKSVESINDNQSKQKDDTEYEDIVGDIILDEPLEDEFERFFEVNDNMLSDMSITQKDVIRELRIEHEVGVKKEVPELTVLGAEFYEDLFTDSIDMKFHVDENPKQEENNDRPRRRSKALSKSKENQVEKQNIIIKLLRKIDLSKIEDENKSKKLKKVNKWLAIIAVLLIVIIYTLINVGDIIKNERTIIKIEQPIQYTGNSNFIHIDETRYIGGEKNQLKKIQIDTIVTKFFFENPINIGEYICVLVDDKGNYYPYTGEYGEVDVLDFRGLNEGVERFRLILKSTTEEENVMFDFKLKNGVINTPTKFIYGNGEDLLPNNDEFDIFLELASFSTAQSSFIFKYYLEEDKDYKMINEKFGDNLFIGKDGVYQYIHDASIVTSYFEEQDMYVSKIDFSPLDNLDGVITIGVKNMFNHFPLNIQLSTKGLMLNQPTLEHSIDLDEYTVNFDNLRKYDDFAVLVAHGVDNEYDRKTPQTVTDTNEYGGETNSIVRPDEVQINPDRVPIILDADLYVTDKNGNEHVIKGDAKISKYGTDVIFEYPGIGQLNSSNLKLIINEVIIINDGFYASMDLDEDYKDDRIEYDDVYYMVKKSFISRLKYHSNEIVKSSITGFSDEIMNEPQMVQMYEPVKSEIHPTYNVTIQNFAFGKENFLCTVKEEWVGVIEGEVVHHSMSHEVVVENINNEYVITKDTIIK